MPTTTALHITSLDRELRKDLERTIGKARMAAEAGAERALQGLGVHLGAAPAHLDKAGRDLRNALRAHGRQAGDVRDERTREQGTGHLVQEVAYAHWHRMLFARFLAENDLLISYEYGVVVDLANAAERAEALGMRDVWEYAAKCAQPMLPQIFPAEDPVLQLALPPESVGALTELLNALPPAVFQATDSLGWVYQFWQTERKREVDDKVNLGEIVEAEDISPKTQLFTEDYMVLFLLHNTLGAWWAGKRMQEPAVLKQMEACASEADCRAVVALPGVDWSYLRWRKMEDGTWTPAAGTFDKWPRTASELKVLDPCMGSGHFLVFALPMLVALRQAEEQLDTAEAVSAVLCDNLYGLELDPRCTQIAAFNLALAAWKMAGHQALPALHLACSGLAPNSTRAEWAAIAELAGAGLDADEQARMKAGMEKLFDLFAQAPTLGSLIDPKRITWDAFAMSPTQVLPLLDEAIRVESDVEVHERAVAAKGLAVVTDLMTRHYCLVITNVPYLKSGNQCEVLKRYSLKYFTAAKADLSSTMIERAHEWSTSGSTIAVVTQQAWFVQKYHERYREIVLKRDAINFIAALGPRAFDAISGEHVNVALQITTTNSDMKGHAVMKCSVESLQGAQDKAAALNQAPVGSILQQKFLELKQCRIILDENHDEGQTIGDVADFGKGSVTGDGFRFLRVFWEVRALPDGYRWWLKDVAAEAPYSGRSHVCLWDVDGHDMSEQDGRRIHGQRVWGKLGIAIGKAGSIRPAMYTGELFDDNIAVLSAYDASDAALLWAFTRSSEFEQTLKRMALGVTVTAGIFPQAPFDHQEWKERTKQGLEKIPEPESYDPRQWLFHGHPAHGEGGTQLQIAVARLLGYRWPPEHDAAMRLSARARQLVQESEALLPFADGDGIVCLPAVQREQPAYKRLQALLAAAYGAEWSPAKERELLAAAGHPEENLEEWLRDSFFKEHCKLFHERPFVWHVWDGLKDGFHALVNYHQLAAPNGGGRRTLEKLIYTYLGE